MTSTFCRQSLYQIRNLIQPDGSLTNLKKVVQNGWPEWERYTPQYQTILELPRWNHSSRRDTLEGTTNNHTSTYASRYTKDRSRPTPWHRKVQTKGQGYCLLARNDRPDRRRDIQACSLYQKKNASRNPRATMGKARRIPIRTKRTKLSTDRRLLLRSGTPENNN